MRHIVSIVLGLSIAAFCGCASSPHLAENRGDPMGAIPSLESTVFAADDRHWEQISEGVRGKFFFSDRITLVYLEMVGAEKRPPYGLHHHHHEQMVYVLEGRSRVQIGDEIREIGPGDVYFVTANTPHTLNALTDKVVMIEVFTPTREDFRQYDAQRKKR